LPVCILRRICGRKRYKVTGDWKKLHNEELHNSHSSPDIVMMIRSRRMRQAGYVACIGKMRNSYTILVGEPDGKRPLRRSKHDKWEDLTKNGFWGNRDGRVWSGFMRTSGGLLWT
jgi:hypothetical protein